MDPLQLNTTRPVEMKNYKLLQTYSESHFDNSKKLAEELTAGLSSQITFSTASLLGENE